VKMLNSMYNLVSRNFCDSEIITYMTSWVTYLENTYSGNKNPIIHKANIRVRNL
jgi:hypothetical protein